MTLPMGGNSDIKNLVFSILVDEYPLKIIELTNYIKRRYGKSVTFQGVRKAILQLVDEGIVKKEDNNFLIDKEWVKTSKDFLNELYMKMVSVPEEKKKNTYDSLGEDLSIFIFDSINEMMSVWQELSDQWYKSHKKGEYNVNCYQAAHSWEVLLHPDVEAKLMGQTKKRGIQAYVLNTENTPLDRSLVKFHENIGVKATINHSAATFDKSHYIGTYGPYIFQAKYPLAIVRKLDKFFKKNMNTENLDLSELSKIANMKTEIKMIVIKNLEMAKQINNSIFEKMDLDKKKTKTFQEQILKGGNSLQ